MVTDLLWGGAIIRAARARGGGRDRLGDALGASKKSGGCAESSLDRQFPRITLTVSQINDEHLCTLKQFAMATPHVHVIIITSRHGTVALHLYTTSVLRQGTLMYHKTTRDFTPSENRSMYFTLSPPSYTHGDRGDRVIEYATGQDLRVMVDLSHAARGEDERVVDPLKYALCWKVTGHAPSSCVELQPHVNAIVRHVQSCGYHAMLTRMDSGANAFEVVCFKPTSSLRFIREYKLTNPG